MHITTVHPDAVFGLIEGALLQGYDCEQILQQRRILLQSLFDPKLRVANRYFSQLSADLWELLKDEAYGLLETPLPLGTWRLQLQSCFAGRNVSEALANWANSANLINSCIACEYDDSSGDGELKFHLPTKAEVRRTCIQDAQLGAAYRLICWLCGEILPLKEVRYKTSAPSFSAEYRIFFYGAPMRFNKDDNALVFCREGLQKPNIRQREELREWIESPHLMVLHKAHESVPLSIRVRLWVESALLDCPGALQIESSAETLGFTSHQLWRALKKEGTSYNQIKDEVRRDVAINLLSSGDLSVEQIGLRLGFAEATTFIRAFKRWTGKTPLGFRKL